MGVLTTLYYCYIMNVMKPDRPYYFAIYLSRPPLPRQLEAAQRYIAGAEENGSLPDLTGAAKFLLSLSEVYRRSHPDTASRLADLGNLAFQAAAELDPELAQREYESIQLPQVPTHIG